MDTFVYATFKKSGVKKVKAFPKKYVMKIKKNVFATAFSKKAVKNEILTSLNTWYILSCTLKRENNSGKAISERSWK